MSVDSYLELFTTLYRSFNEDWRKQVFFYLCMENRRFWKPVFGFEHADNQAFEAAMLSADSPKTLSQGRL